MGRAGRWAREQAWAERRSFLRANRWALGGFILAATALVGLSLVRLWQQTEVLAAFVAAPRLSRWPG